MFLCSRVGHWSCTSQQANGKGNTKSNGWKWSQTDSVSLDNEESGSFQAQQTLDKDVSCHQSCWIGKQNLLCNELKNCKHGRQELHNSTTTLKSTLCRWCRPFDGLRIGTSSHCKQCEWTKCEHEDDEDIGRIRLGQVPSHTFLLIGRFLPFCIRLVPEMNPCEIRKNGRWTQRYCVSNVSTTIITWPVCSCLIKATLSSDSHQLQCMKLQHFKLDIFNSI